MGGKNRSGEHGMTGPDGASRAPRMLVVTSLYPTPDRPESGPFVRRRVDALRAAGVNVDVIAASDYRATATRRHLSMLVRGILHRPRPDGVEGHVLFPAGLVAFWVARRHRCPLILYAHGADVGISAQRTAFHLALARLVARSADAIVTNSSATAARVGRLGGTAVVIPPGVDFERFQPGDRGAARRRVGLPDGARIALYVGALSRRKGADTFAEAIANAPNWLGVMVGRGELAPVLSARGGSLRIVGSVPPDDVPVWMMAADAVVVPSRDEPLGLAAVEALACGIPVIAAAVGGLTEVVRHESNGLLVPPAQPIAVADALRRLEDPSFRDSLACGARDSVAEHDLRRTTARMAEQWQALGVRT